MLQKTRLNFNRFKRVLLRQKRTVEEELEEIEKEDPLSSDDLAESADSGTDNWLAEAHGKTVAMKNSLQSLLGRIQKSLLSIKKGSYGKCENCGKTIEAGRLKAMPTATLCIACSKKVARA